MNRALDRRCVCDMREKMQTQTAQREILNS
jgi:hypothetical protein